MKKHMKPDEALGCGLVAGLIFSITFIGVGTAVWRLIERCLR